MQDMQKTRLQKKKDEKNKQTNHQQVDGDW